MIFFADSVIFTRQLFVIEISNQRTFLSMMTALFRFVILDFQEVLRTLKFREKKMKIKLNKKKSKKSKMLLTKSTIDHLSKLITKQVKAYRKKHQKHKVRCRSVMALQKQQVWEKLRHSITQSKMQKNQNQLTAHQKRCFKKVVGPLLEFPEEC
jgi:hypothetical protein